MNEKRHSKYTKIKKNEILELSDKDFKAAIINMFWQVIMSYLGTNENKKITKETEIVKKIKAGLKNKMNISMDQNIEQWARLKPGHAGFPT